ncbi:MAG: glycosyltransferase [Planctomycetaceae bacterium]|nr:glycosyltransferase [Planctomycetaceae bacterium]
MTDIESFDVPDFRPSHDRHSGLLMFADDWGRHPSSPQHLIRRIRDEIPVLWVNTIGTRSVGANRITISRGFEKIRNWSRGLKQVHDQMWVVDVPMLPMIGSRAARYTSQVMVTQYLRWCLKQIQMTQPTVMTTVPHVSWMLGDVGQEKMVYYCTDDFSHWPGADQETLVQSERDLVSGADLVLAVSRKLMDRHCDSADCRYFPHAVDFDHFSLATGAYGVHPEMERLPGPRIGYFGLIYEKLDFELLTAIARAHSDASLVLIGPTAWCPEDFASLPNVTLTGAQPYESLPEWLAGLDVLLMPYRSDDEMIRQSSPLKLRECLATGKPTVCVDVPEARRYEPFVRVTSSRDEFLRAVYDAVREKDESAREARQEFVRVETWDNRARQLLEMLSGISHPGLKVVHAG